MVFLLKYIRWQKQNAFQEPEWKMGESYKKLLWLELQMKGFLWSNEMMYL